MRPQRLADFIGQDRVRANLAVFVESARKSETALDHVLLVGAPGLGKTTMAQIIGRELAVPFRSSSGPVITGAAEIAALFTDLKERELVFIDEIHRLRPGTEEILYSAMEDHRMDVVVGEKTTLRTMKLKLPKFTLIGGTTRAGLLTAPLRDRFGITLELTFYSERELTEIVVGGAQRLGIGIVQDGAREIARRARGTPRIALRLLRRVRDFALVQKQSVIEQAVADRALLALEVDHAGLNALDRRYLSTIAMHYGGGPVGLDTIATALSEPCDALEQIVEPYLIRVGFLQRTPRGRCVTPRVFDYLGLARRAPNDDLCDSAVASLTRNTIH